MFRSSDRSVQEDVILLASEGLSAFETMYLFKSECGIPVPEDTLRHASKNLDSIIARDGSTSPDVDVK